MSFKDIKGQDKAITILKEHIKHSRLASAYLFVGPEGIGKRQAAKTLAKALNCQEQSLDTSTALCFDKLSIRPERAKRVEGLSVNGERSRTIDSCDACPSCLKIEKNQYPDVYIIDASTPTDFDNSDSGDSHAVRIGHIRQLQRNISLRPYEGRCKVFIIDNAHNLTAEASNALLKILEEPPGNSLLILVTAKPTLLFKTIISRCQTLKFYPLARNKLEGILKNDYSLDNNLSHFLAYFCEGRIGGALKLKDTDILKEKNSVIDTFILSRNFRLDNLSIQKRDNIREYLNMLAAWFRDIYLIKIGTAHTELINCDRKTDLLKFMQHFSFLDLDEIFKTISDSVLRLDENINVKLLMSNLRMEVWRG